MFRRSLCVLLAIVPALAFADAKIPTQDLKGSADPAGLGRYEGASGRRVSGPGLCDVVSELEPALGSRLGAEIERGVVAARALPSPFDRALAGPDSAPGRAAIAAAIAALSAQAETLKRAASRLAPTPAVATR